MEEKDKIDMCGAASMNARTLEEMLLTTGHVMALDMFDAEDVVDMCEQIIHCMRECFDAYKGE